MLTSELIAQHTAEYLAAGGVIELVPFLHTTRPSPDVLRYKRVHRYGERDYPLGERLLSDEIHNHFDNHGGDNE